MPSHNAFAASLALIACAHAGEPAWGNAAPGAKENAAPACAALLGGGSPDVLIEGRGSGRTGDSPCLQIIDGARSVFANGRPTLRVGDQVRCPDGRSGVVQGGASSVFIEGRPAATAQSRIAGCE